MLRPTSASRWLIVVLGVLGPFLSLAAADSPVPRGPSHEPAPYRYDPGQWKKVPAEFLDDAPACVLYSCTNHLIEPDGTVESITHDITRLNSRKAIETLGEYTFISYDPSYQKVILNEARIHKPNGQIIPVEAKSIQVRDVRTDYLVYDQSKQVILSFPGLQVGDVYEVKWTLRGKHPEYGGQWFTRYGFGADKYPVVLDEFRVRLPKNKTFSHDSTGKKLKPTVTEDRDTRTYHWSMANVPTLLPRDEDLPSKDYFRTLVVCSTFGTWKEVAEWEKRLLRECWECTPEIKKIVAEVTRGMTDPVAKARALTYWVRSNIRYVSAGEKHDYTPHRPAAVLSNRHGDCKDGSQLLAVMLRQAGIEASLVTLCTRNHGQILESVPSPWGSHAMVMATIHGKNHWIDTTAPLPAWDFLPTSDRDRVCYVTNESGLRLMRTPALTPEENWIEQTTEVTVGVDGSSRSVRQATYHGLSALLHREKWHEEPEGERRRVVAAKLQDSNSRVRLSWLEIEEASLRDFDRPVQARIEYLTPDHFVGTNELEGTVSDSYVWNYLLGYTPGYERTAPMELWEPFESRHRFIVHAPPGYEFLGAPSEKHFTSRWGSFTRKGKVLDKTYRTVQVDLTLRIERTLIEPRDFDEFRDFHRQVSNNYRGWLTLEKVQNPKHIPELEALVRLDPEATAYAITLANLYRKQEKPEEARRVLQFALQYRPQDGALWEQIVGMSPNPAEEEKQLRELIKRFPDEPRHALALGTLLTDRGQQREATEVLKAIQSKGTMAMQSQVNLQLARSAYHQQQYELARLYLTMAGLLEAKTTNTVEANVLKARIFEGQKKPTDAIDAYNDALKLDPKAEAPLLGLIRLHLAARQHSEALQQLMRYVLAVDRNGPGLVRGADFALQLQAPDLALALARRARTAGAAQGADRILGLIDLRRGRMEEAATHLARAGNDPEVLAGLLRAQLRLGDLTGAEKTIARVATLPAPGPTLKVLCEGAQALLQKRQTYLKELAPRAAKQPSCQSAIDRYLCAEVAFNSGESASTVEGLLNESLSTGVELAAARALRAQLQLQKGQLQRALSEAEKALKLGPREARAWYVRGRVRLERGRLESLGDLLRAVELSQRREPVYLHGLAEAQYQAGEKEAARTSLREALKLRPTPEWLDLLAEWEKALGTTGARIER